MSYMKRTSKFLSLLLALAMVCSLFVPAMAAEKEEGIVVLYTNDIHCTSDDGLSYAAIAGYKAQMEDTYGTGNVTLVDTGDAIQGGILGSMSSGSWIIDIMNAVGYDLAIPGNHEFDFGMETFLDIVENQAEFPYLSCNFVDADGNPVLEAYQIISYGDVDVEKDFHDCLSHIAYVHLKDKAGGRQTWDFPALGKGYVPFPALFRMLEDSGNDAPFSIEIEFTQAGPKSLEEINQAVKDSARYLLDHGYTL